MTVMIIVILIIHTASFVCLLPYATWHNILSWMLFKISNTISWLLFNDPWQVDNYKGVLCFQWT